MISTGFPYAGAPWCIGPGIAAPGRSIPDEGEGYPWGWWERLQYSAYNVYICNDMCAYHVYSYICIYIYINVCVLWICNWIYTKTLQWYIYLCIDFILLVLWIFARLQKTALLQKKCSRGFIPSPLSVGFVTAFEFAAFCIFFWIFAFFLRKFSFELVSHQSKQFLFSVELG